MSNKPTADDSWEACPPGMLRGLAAQGQSRARRTLLLKAGTVAASLLLLGGVYVLLPEQGPDFGGVSCEVVHANLERYLNKQLDAPTTKRFERHLSQCPHCGPELEKLRTQASAITYWWRTQVALVR